MIGLSAAMRIAFVAGLALPNISIANSEMAAPWIILVEDEGTNQRAALTDWDENLKLMSSIGAPLIKWPKGTVAATGLRVALFWGPHWKEWRKAGIDPRVLSFESASQYARLYLATDVDSAYWQYDGPYTLRPQLRVIDSLGLRILESHGVPVRSGRAVKKPPRAH